MKKIHSAVPELKLVAGIAAVVLSAAGCGGPSAQARGATTTTGAQVEGSVDPAAWPTLPASTTEPTPAEAASPPPAISPPSAPVVETASTARDVAPGLTDAEIAAAVDAELAGERQQAREAAKGTNDAEIVRFTERVLADDSHASPRFERAERVAGIALSNSATSAALRSGAVHTVDSLRAAGAGNLDKVYVDAQVGEDRQFIALLDNTLIPSARNSDLRTLLEELRAATSRHLTVAEEIQSRLAKR